MLVALSPFDKQLTLGVPPPHGPGRVQDTCGLLPSGLDNFLGPETKLVGK